MTAYLTKTKLSCSRVEIAVSEFLSANFEDFLSKYTMWELLWDSPEIGPRQLSKVNEDLLATYKWYCYVQIIDHNKREQSIFHQDLNAVVAALAGDAPEGFIKPKQGRRKKKVVEQ